jgi:hypothetical protein
MSVELALAGLAFAIIGHDSPHISAIAIGLAIILTVTAFTFTYIIQKAE